MVGVVAPCATPVMEMLLEETPQTQAMVVKHFRGRFIR